MTEKLYLIKKAGTPAVSIRVERIIWDPVAQTGKLSQSGGVFPFPEFMRVYNDLLLSDKGYNPDFQIPETEAGLCRQCSYLLRSNNMYSICTPEGHIASFIKLTPNPAESRLDISDLYTVPDYRSRGLARNLIYFAENLANSMNLDNLFLDTYINNLPAIKFYSGLDFAPAVRGNFSLQPPYNMSPEELEYIRQSISQQHQREFSLGDVMDYIKRLSLLGLAASAFTGYREGKGESVSKLVELFPYVNACVNYFHDRGAGNSGASLTGLLTEMGMNYLVRKKVRERTENSKHE